MKQEKTKIKVAEGLLIGAIVILVPLFLICVVALFLDYEKEPVYTDYRPKILENVVVEEDAVPGDEIGHDTENGTESGTETAEDEETITASDANNSGIKGNSSNGTNHSNVDCLEDVKKENSDAVAWIIINDTNIDYPVVQAKDNEYYLHRDFHKKSKKAGVPFMDYRCEADFSGFNSILYGHNMKSKTMFAHVNLFKDKEFFDTHSEGVLVLSDGVYDITIFAVMVLPSDGFVYETVFLSAKEKQAFCDKIKQNAKYYREPAVDLTETGIITLSTCSYEFTNARTVVLGYATKRV